MHISITLFYGGALAFWYVLLTVRVIQGRAGPGKPSLGDGGDPLMQRRIRAHANFSEYVPLVLVLMGLLEISGAAPWSIHVVGACLLVGRLLHGYAFSFTEHFVFGRMAGMILTFIALLSAGGMALIAGLKGF